MKPLDLKGSVNMMMYGATSDGRHTAYTVELPWLEPLWNHENMFVTGVVGANECQSLHQVRRYHINIFSIFFNMKVCCVFSLESPRQGDSNEHTIYYVQYMYKKRKSP